MTTTPRKHTDMSGSSGFSSSLGADIHEKYPLPPVTMHLMFYSDPATGTRVYTLKV
jgi:hypothetical protein